MQKKTCEQTYCPNFIDHADMGRIISGRWRNENETIKERLRPCSAHRATREAYDQRNILTKYLLSSASEIT